MKRFLALLMAMVMVFTLAACGKDTAENGSSDVSTTTSDTMTNESTDDSKSSTTSSEAQSSETESSKDSRTATTSKQQSADNPATSSKNNTTSSKPSNTTSTPTTSKPTTPSTPNTPTKPSLPFRDLFDGGNALALTDKNTNGITANRILNRSSYEIFHAYIYDNLSSIETKNWKYQLGNTTHNLEQYAVPESVVYQYAAQFFNIDTTTKNILKTSDRYDSSKGIYWIYANDPWFSNGDDAEIKGYENLGNDEYIVYAQAKEKNHLWPCSDCATTNSCVISQPCFKAKIKATGKSSYIVLSFEYIDSIPSNITKN